MTTSITTFNFSPELQLRAIDIKGEPWFVAKDICDALSMAKCPKNGYSDWLRGLDTDEVASPAQFAGVKIPGVGMHCAKLINESGLYSLILKSRKPEAKRFKKWVTSEVLPSIRKTGSYSVLQAAPPAPASTLPAPLLDGEDIRQVIKTVSQTAELALQVLQMVREVHALGRPRL